MSIFTINSDIPFNSQNSNAYYNEFRNLPSGITGIIDNPNNIYVKYGRDVYDQKSNGYINDDQSFTLNNNARSIALNLTPKAVREFKYNIFLNRFDPGYPENIRYNLCDQTVSTVFKSGRTYWTQSKSNDVISYPMSNNFGPVVTGNSSPQSNCNDCQYTDFSGEYILDWSATGAKLISSNNSDVSSGSFDFNVSGNFFDIFLYANNGNTYIHVRYRIPVRYRYAYEDWAYWESLLISGEMSETEFVKVINCCEEDSPSPPSPPSPG